MDREIIITGTIVIILGLVGLLYAFTSYLTMVQLEAISSTVLGQLSGQTAIGLNFFKNQIIAIMIVSFSTMVAGAGLISVGKKKG